MKKVIAIGELLWDLLPSGKCIGGAPLNFAYWATRAGCKGAIISAIGGDSLGEELRADIDDIGVNLSALQVNPSPTGTVEVVLSAEGEPSYIIHEDVAWDNILDAPEAYELVKEADAICWGSLAQRTEKCRRNILKLIDASPAGCLKVFDINIRQNFYSWETIKNSLERADILKLNEDELPLVMEMFGESDVEALLKRFSLRYVILTEGAKQSTVIGEGIRSVIPTPRVEVVSTVGAGDSFTATFVAEYLAGTPIPEAHRKAVEVSADVCTRAGAIC